jgi:hypothetical protein
MQSILWFVSRVLGTQPVSDSRRTRSKSHPLAGRWCGVERLEARELLSVTAGPIERPATLADLPQAALEAISTSIGRDQPGFTVASLNQQAKLTGSDRKPGDDFGYTVAISGDTVVIGAPWADVSGHADQGAVYVFVKPAGGWGTMTQTAKITATDGAAGDHFGWSVGVSGDTIVVGSPAAATAGGAGQGAAYAFSRAGGVWGQAKKLYASDGGLGAMFGYAVAISGTTALVGAEDATVNGNPSQGEAYIYDLPNLTGPVVTETIRFSAPDGYSWTHFGNAVAISGDTAVVGAIGASTVNASWTGAAYVFVKPDTGWSDLIGGAKLSNLGAKSNDNIGASVAISGSTIVVGATQHGSSGFGAAYLFTQPAGGWIDCSPTVTLSASDISYVADFGASVGISGDSVIVGAPNVKVGTQSNQGAAYVFDKPASGWTPTMTESGRLTASDGILGDNFGSAAAIDGGTAVVGARSDDGVGSGYVYTTAQAAPVVTGISPTSGPTTGGTKVTITGTGFSGATAVKFGTTAAASYTVDSATQITAVSPAGSGTVDVRVTNATGTSATSTADRFTYVAAANVDLRVTVAGPMFAMLSNTSKNIVYTFTLTNKGPVTATGITLIHTPTLETGVTVTSVVPSAGSYSDATGVWTVPSLAKGAKVTLTVTLTGSASTPKSGHVSDKLAVTGADQKLTNPADDSAQKSTTVKSKIKALASVQAVSVKDALFQAGSWCEEAATRLSRLRLR